MFIIDNNEFIHKLFLFRIQKTLEERFAKIDKELVVNELKTLHDNAEMLSPVMKKIMKNDIKPNAYFRL